ncbi:GNAT family N-acetyltransferase [Ferrimonas aestuarii]|uniref:Protein ElaA n=1 Tax=Ferrimonas aestuarii TaxID=2569539 RepID=A0A4U1BJP5_9GAMM|nr:GNAT family N-acetyltransferase [Ferrimonas aestuarii]TKB51650.1 GNAT family N-acetyltransferase [Ferrimonas aestuarii]
MIHWKLIPFHALTNMELYQLLKLRTDVFVVEQTCPYPELDDKDHQQGVYHLLGYQEDELIACARLLPGGISYANASIGRVATKLSKRGGGLGHQLLEQALSACERLWPNESVTISAQEHLAGYYGRHGFVQVSEMYLEDDIPHIKMTLEK